MFYVVEFCKIFPRWCCWSLRHLQFKTYCASSFSCINFNVKYFLRSAKSGKVSSASSPFIFNDFSENMITFVRLWLFLQMKNIFNLRQLHFFGNQAACTYFLNAFHTKKRLSQGLLQYMELLKNVLCNIRYEL